MQQRVETVCFVVFMAGIVVWRAWETWRKQGEMRGRTSMQWSFYAMVALTGAVSRESAEKAVLARVPEAFLELNKKAFNLGYEKALAANK